MPDSGLRNVKANPAREAGFGLPVVLGILVLLGFASWILAQGSAGGASQLSQAAAQSSASAVISQANSLEAAVQFAAFNGRNPVYVELTAEPNFGLYHPDVGGLSPLTPLPRAQQGSEPLPGWAFVKIALPGYGSGLPELVAVLPAIRAEVCLALSQSINGPLAVVKETGAISQGLTTSWPAYVTVGGDPGDPFYGEPMGCLRDNGNHFAYRVLAVH